MKYVKIILHVNVGLSAWSWGWHCEGGLHALRLIMSSIFDRLPTLQIIIGHMGEMIPFMLSRIDDTLTADARHLKRKISEYIHENFYITTSGFFTYPPLLTALQTIGSDRIIFSVDYPYSANEQGRAFLDNVPISPDDKAKTSHLNAERLLGLTSVTYNVGIMLQSVLTSWCLGVLLPYMVDILGS